ncbi:ABC transporter permease [Tenacibaculum sp. 190130A14a]|uniref:Lipoprotein-releasing system permease protein n=2 Tax=Tenacibaculum polynesiense TaxID=3137857 RepID=A0ABM9PBB4_9FLAO
MFGVVVGTLALFVILSGFSGLRTLSDSLLEASDPDIKIFTKEGKKFEYTDRIKKILEGEEVAAASGVVEERVFIRYKDKQEIAQIKGVDTYYNEVVAIDSSLTVGNWLDTDYVNTAVIGYGLAYKLSVSIYSFGEGLQVFVPKPGKGFVNPASAFRSKTVQLTGVYSGSEEFQNKYIFTNLNLAQELLQYNSSQVSAVEVKLKDAEMGEAFRTKLQKELGDTFLVKTRAELNALYYKVVNTENFISYLIFTLVIIIALFNVIGSIIMMIIDKKHNLKTLVNLGASLQEVKRIFVFQGFLLTLIGMGIGLLIGIVAVLFQQTYGWFKITATLPYPVEFRWVNLLVVVITISTLGYSAAKIASARINMSFLK